jgi:hypothetical protein
MDISEIRSELLQLEKEREEVWTKAQEVMTEKVNRTPGELMANGNKLSPLTKRMEAIVSRMEQLGKELSDFDRSPERTK